MNTAHSDQNLQGRPRMVHAVKTMPKWKWTFITIGLIVGSIGLAGQVSSHLMKSATPVQTTGASTPAAGTPAGSSGFVGGQPQAAPSDSSSTSTPAASSTLFAAMSPFMSHFGFSLFTGIIVGLIFRTFIRMALLLSALIVGGAMALSYFGHINIDLTAVKADSSQAVSWLTDQGYRLKDMLFGVLPSSTAATIGFLLGFKKR